MADAKYGGLVSTLNYIKGRGGANAKEIHKKGRILLCIVDKYCLNNKSFILEKTNKVTKG
jgi:hypothetical protein